MPNLGIKTNLEKYKRNVLQIREKLDELEADYKIRKTKLDINVRYLESDEKKYAELNKKSHQSVNKFIKLD